MNPKQSFVITILAISFAFVLTLTALLLNINHLKFALGMSLITALGGVSLEKLRKFLFK